MTDIFPRLTHVHYLTLVDDSSGYYNMYIDKNHRILILLHVNLAGTYIQDCHLMQ